MTKLDLIMENLSRSMEKEGDELHLKEKSLKLSVTEGGAFSVMDGFGLRYITPYAVALGMSNFLIGVLSSLPTVFGSLSQLKSAKMLENHSRKKIVLWSVILQTLSWIPIIFIGYAYFFLGLSSIAASVLLLIFYTMLITFGTFAAPAWSSWMRDLISRNTDTYFARRNRIVGGVAFLSMLTAGYLLSYFKDSGFLGFAVIFGIALIGRSFSAYLFTKNYEPKMKKSEGYYFSFLEFTEKMWHNNFGHFVIFSSLISFAVAIASPFFSVYMLEDLGFDYLSYTIIIIIPVAVTLLTLPFWGRFGDKYGNIQILRVCGSFIFLVPFFWLLTPFLADSPKTLLTYLILTEAFSGVIWAGFNLATATFVFHAVSRERLHLCVAYNGILNAIGAFLGALLGGILASKDFGILGMKGLLFVFLISMILRFVFFFVFIGKVKEVRPVESFKMINFRKILANISFTSVLEDIGVRRTGHAPLGGN